MLLVLLLLPGLAPVVRRAAARHRGASCVVSRVTIAWHGVVHGSAGCAAGQCDVAWCVVCGHPTWHSAAWHGV